MVPVIECVLVEFGAYHRDPCTIYHITDVNVMHSVAVAEVASPLPDGGEVQDGIVVHLPVRVKGRRYPLDRQGNPPFEAPT